MPGSPSSSPGTPPLDTRHSDPSRDENQRDLAERVHKLVRQAAENPKTSTSIYGQLIPAALQYVTQDAAAKKSHFFCHKDGPPETSLHTCMLRVFSFNAAPEISEWLQMLAKTLYSCSRCYKGYLLAKESFPKMFLSTFPAGIVENFLDHIEEWEEEVALSVFDKGEVRPNLGLGFLAPPELYALLSIAASRSKIRQKVAEIMTMHQLSSTLLEVPAGLLRFAISEDARERQWVSLQLRDRRPASMPPEVCQTRCVRRTIEDLTLKLRSTTISQQRIDELWEAISQIYFCAPMSLFPLASVIFSYLHDNSSRLPHILRAFDGVLQAHGAKIWIELGGEDPEYPLVVLSSIFDNPSYIQAFGSSDDEYRLQPYIGWMPTLLASLPRPGKSHGKQSDPLDVSSISSCRRDTPLRHSGLSVNVHAEVLKRITNFLLERLQKPHVLSRSIAVQHGLSLLINAFESLDDLASTSLQSISRVVGLYARTITALAFQGKLPGSIQVLHHNDRTRQKAQHVVLLILDADQTMVTDAIRSLSRIAQRHSSRWRQRRKSGQPDAEQIYLSAARESYPSPSICSELWSNAYQSFNAGGPAVEVAHTAGLFLKPLANIALFSEPQLATHLLPSPNCELQGYTPYKQAVKTCIVGISRHLRAMRSNLPSLLTELAEIDFGCSQQNLIDLCVRLSQELVVFNLSPIPELHNAAQNVVRSAYPDVESRTDVFKALLSSTTSSLLGIETALSLFIQACMELVEANDAAKWIVRSGADILDVLCSRTGGLLRSGAEHSYVDRGADDLGVLEEVLPRIWELKCRSIAAIFQKTPKWSEHIAKEDMVAWFRDVNIFSSQLTEQVETMQKAANAKRRSERRLGKLQTDKEEEVSDFIVSCLALPLEQAMSWLRINDIEIVNETMNFITKALDCFQDDVELPLHTRDKMLKFVREQIEVQNAEDRKTLLSVRELIDLQVRLDHRARAISNSDSEDEGVSFAAEEPRKVSVKVEGSAKERKNDPQQSWLAAMTSLTKSVSSSAGDEEQKRKQRKLRQRKLNFSAENVVDSDAFVSKADAFQQRLSATLTSPIPQGQAASSLNKYKIAAASANLAKKAALQHIPNFNMTALRQQFSAAQNRFGTGVRRPQAAVSHHLSDMKQPRAPAAINTLAGATTGKNGPASAAVTTVPKKPSDSDSSGESDDDDDDNTPKGLAALEQAAQSQAKTYIKHSAERAAQPRRTKLLDDGAIDRARKDRQEAERKCRLRAPTDLRPLHQSILEWSWYDSGDIPPPPRSGAPPHYAPIPTTFRNADHYGAVFGPMLILECWAQFLQAKEDFERGVIPMYTCEVQGRVSIDAFVEISALMTANTPTSFRLGENDVVIMRLRQDGFRHDEKTFKPRMLLAKVETFKNHAQGKQIALRCVLEGDKQGLSSNLVNRSLWDIGALFALNTVNREFGALLTLPFYDLVRDIMQAKVSARIPLSPKDIQMMLQTYGVNPPQAEAILGSLQGQGFSLIQGPPGTGKTKTICALVAHFVATRKTPQNIGAGGRAAAQAIPKKLLICAPSNAAIDEVARRVKIGMKGPDGRVIKVNVIRLGRDDAMNIAVKDLSLDNLIEQALSKYSRQFSDGSTVDQLLAEVRSLRDEKDTKQGELEQARATGNHARAKNLEMEIRGLTSKRMTASQKLDEARDKRQSNFRQMDADRRRVRNEILLNADVICSTLSGAGHEALASLPIDFETVVIDEAAQAVEASTIIPLRYGCKRCILVGDPNQLPPTVISATADKFKYSRSLFVRMFEQARDQTYLLSIQYRMHPEISTHPSQTFYAGRLEDGPDMARLTTRPWHTDHLLPPFRFFSVKGAERSSLGHSYLNVEESQLAVAIYERLKRAAPGFDFDGKVGCVTMYKGQVMELKRAFANRYGSGIEQRVDFNTVDGFQGQEKDIIILSCVRSGQNGLGFLTDARRINVAVTRAKSSLFIVGNADGLRKASGSPGLWRHLIDQSEAREALQVAHKATFLAPIGPVRGSRESLGQDRKAGRARTVGWIAADRERHQRSSPHAPARTEPLTGRTGDPSNGSSNTSSIGPSSKRAKVGPDDPKVREDGALFPPLPAGMQTMRPSNTGTSTTKPSLPSLPSRLQTVRPSVPGTNAADLPTRPGGHSRAAGRRQGENKSRVVRPSNSAPPGSGGGESVVVRLGSAFHRQRYANGGGPTHGGPSGPAPPLPPPIRTRPPACPPGGQDSLTTNASGASVPSQAAMDALFVKKRKR